MWLVMDAMLWTIILHRTLGECDRRCKGWLVPNRRVLALCSSCFRRISVRRTVSIAVALYRSIDRGATGRHLDVRPRRVGAVLELGIVSLFGDIWCPKMDVIFYLGESRIPTFSPKVKGYDMF